jgi:hypothetical protein
MNPLEMCSTFQRIKTTAAGRLTDHPDVCKSIFWLPKKSFRPVPRMIEPQPDVEKIRPSLHPG